MPANPSGSVPSETNGPSTEATVGALLGGGLTLIGLQRKSLFGLAVAALGFTIVRRSLAGNLDLSFGMNDDAERKAVRNLGIPLYSGGDDGSDPVEEASMESFPASDPPAYSKSKS